MQSDVPAALPPNLQPGSSFGFLQPWTPGALPYNLSMPPASSTEQGRPTMSLNIPYFQAPPQSESFGGHSSQPSRQASQPSRKNNQMGGGKGKEHWTVQEDLELCVAWLKISEDPIIGTGQQQAAF